MLLFLFMCIFPSLSQSTTEDRFYPPGRWIQHSGETSLHIINHLDFIRKPLTSFSSLQRDYVSHISSHFTSFNGGSQEEINFKNTGELFQMYQEIISEFRVDVVYYKTYLRLECCILFSGFLSFSLFPSYC